MSIPLRKQSHKPDRMKFIGGSDARIIMGKDEKALLQLWREKRGEVAVVDLSRVLIVQLGLVTEDLNRRWYELNSGHRISDIQRHAVHRTLPWMAATLDGLVKETGAVFEAKFMMPWSFSEEAAAEKHMAQLQHNMLVAGTRKSVVPSSTAAASGLNCRPKPQTILIAAEKADAPSWSHRRPRRVSPRRHCAEPQDDGAASTRPAKRWSVRADCISGMAIRPWCSPARAATPSQQ